MLLCPHPTTATKTIPLKPPSTSCVAPKPVRRHSRTDAPSMMSAGQKVNDEEFCSKSLGDHVWIGSSAMSHFHRQSSTPVRTTGYSGYLLKRSNGPYLPSTSSSSSDLQVQYYRGHHSDHQSSLAGIPKLPNLTKSSKFDFNSTATESSSEDDVIGGGGGGGRSILRQPQHRSLDDRRCGAMGLSTSASISRGGQSPSVISSHGKDENIERAIAMMSDFFGITPLSKSPPPPSSLSPSHSPLLSKQRYPLSPPTSHSPHPLPPSPPRHITRPILMSSPSPRPSPPPSPVRRHISTPSSSANAPPNDIIDPHDGHIWRAKYCVLQNGTLYFYRNKSDAESAEARSCRDDPLTGTSSTGGGGAGGDHSHSLSQSPIPRACRAGSHGRDGLWEKKVALDRVGAVRSAEDEFGNWSFVLLTNEEDGSSGVGVTTTDCLVLRAGSTVEMQEWLFRIHLSLAGLMQQIVRSVKQARGRWRRPVGSGEGRSEWGDGRVLIPPVTVPAGVALPQVGMESYSPASIHLARGGLMTLSHGHGRSNAHRRRARTGSVGVLTPGDVSPAFSVGSWDIGGAIPLGFMDSMPDIGNGELIMKDLKEPIIMTGATVPDNDEAGEASDENASLSLSKGCSAMSTTPVHSHCKKPKEMPEKSSKGKYIPPHLRKKQDEHKGSLDVSSSVKKYIPPHLRNKNVNSPPKPSPAKYIPPHLRSSHCAEEKKSLSSLTNEDDADLILDNTSLEMFEMTDDETTTPTSPTTSPPPPPHHHSRHLVYGGCADPSLVIDSVLHPMYKSSSSGKCLHERSESYGSHGGSSSFPSSSLRWDVGAVSERGIRDSNEDAFLVVNDLTAAYESEETSHFERWGEGSVKDIIKEWGGRGSLAAFAIFDGHCGSQAARYATETIVDFLGDSIQYENLANSNRSDGAVGLVLRALENAMARLDDEFCNLCTEDGRNWESGATALVVVLVDDTAIVANVGDCRGVMGASASADDGRMEESDDGWHHLEIDPKTKEPNETKTNDDSDQQDSHLSRTTRSYWKELTEAHRPSRPDEKRRIEAANGWVTTELDVCIGQLQRMDFYDDDVVDILKRCFADRFDDDDSDNTDNDAPTTAATPGRLLSISRVCGELAVSRAIGDRDFKAAFNNPPPPPPPVPMATDDNRQSSSPSSSPRRQKDDARSWWDGPDFLPYPREHNGCFEGDLITATPEIQTVKLGTEGLFEEFILLACDGLWDVMDADDAIRVARDLLFDKRWSAKKAAARLAELAIHLGSSDNTTVILIRLSRDSLNNECEDGRHLSSS